MRSFVPAVLAVGASLAIAGAAGAQAKTREQKIQNAMEAAPASISSKAKILDWPAAEGAKPAVLREGTDDWVCYPDFPGTEGNDPMCLDQVWQAWMDAYMNKKKPEISRTGIGYMIAPGGGWGSNTDPYATKQTADNQWGFHPPHLMILEPDEDALKGLTTDPHHGGPWVMWAGTPYVHIMVPVSAGKKP